MRALFELLWLAASAAMALLLVSARYDFDVERAWRAWEWTAPYSAVGCGMVAGSLALAIAGVRYAWIVPESALRRGNARVFAAVTAGAACLAFVQGAAVARNLLPLDLDARRLVQQIVEWPRLQAAAFLLLAGECAFATLRTAWLGWMLRPRASGTD